MVVCLRTLSTTSRTHPTASWLKNKAARIHSPFFIDLVAELMEPIHAEFLRLATELEAVKCQVQTACNALRDLFARTTTALSSSGSQHDRRLNHREAGRHLPQQFGGSRLDYGDFVFPMEGYAAVLLRDGHGGALLREVAKLEKFEDNMIETLGEDLLGCPTFECSYGSCSNQVHPRRGSNAGKKNYQCEPWRWTSSFVRSHTLVQTQISGGASGVDGESHIAQANQERE